MKRRTEAIRVITRLLQEESVAICMALPVAGDCVCQHIQRVSAPLAPVHVNDNR